MVYRMVNALMISKNVGSLCIAFRATSTFLSGRIRRDGQGKPKCYRVQLLSQMVNVEVHRGSDRKY